MNNDCVCPLAGYCERYKRRMVGRLYELCSRKYPLERPDPGEEKRSLELRRLASRAQPGAVFAESKGPGTKLKDILDKFGIPGCMGCNMRAAAMNHWGPDGCRERRSEIVGWLKEGAAKTGLVLKISVFRKLRKESWFRYRDPYGAIVDESIRQAEVDQRCTYPAT